MLHPSNREINRIEKRMRMNKIVKRLIQFLIEAVAMTILLVGIKIFANGMYPLGLPDLEDIQSVSISCPSVTNEIKEVSSHEDIELALNLTGFLKSSE